MLNTHENPRIVDGLAFEDMGDQVIVYHPATKFAHALTESAAGILLLCDGTNSVSAITAEYTAVSDFGAELSAQHALTILREFKSLGLIDNDQKPSAA